MAKKPSKAADHARQQKAAYERAIAQKPKPVAPKPDPA